jgi:type 1 glutamine amidotransferase
MAKETTMNQGFGAVAAVVLAVASGAAVAQDRIATLLITGQNNHNWRYTSRVHEETLEATGRFDVDVTEDPGAVLADAAAVKKYKLFVLDYNDKGKQKPWAPEAEKNLVEAVRGGAGLVALHAAIGAFEGWKDYDAMLGLVWREGAGHGKYHEFSVEPAGLEHPVMAGLKAFTTSDELYHRLSNPSGAGVSILARAMSSAESGGTGAQEPMVYCSNFGSGHVFAMTLGHVWEGQIASKTTVTGGPFRALLARGSEWAATGAVTLPTTWRDLTPHNVLSEQEKAEGWTLLFDGADAKHFRGFKQEAMPPKGWEVKDGMLHRPAGEGGGDIITREQFGDFELSLQWRLSQGGNSGVIYRCTEEFKWVWETGLEMQILDDGGHKDGSKAKTSAGALYDLVSPAHDVARPVGEWNTARIVARGPKIEHWLNGVKIVEAELGSEAYKKAYAESKWPTMPNMGTRLRGHIALQDHGDEVWFRDIKVRELK